MGLHGRPNGTLRATTVYMKRGLLVAAAAILIAVAVFWTRVERDFPSVECSSLWTQQVQALALKSGEVRLYVKIASSAAAENSTVGVFKIDHGEKTATRVPVQFGVAVQGYIEVRGGLNAGDHIIASDMARFDQYDRIMLDGC